MWKSITDRFYKFWVSLIGGAGLVAAGVFLCIALMVIGVLMPIVAIVKPDMITIS